MRTRRILLTAVLAVVIAACGDDSGGGLFTTTTAATTITTTTVAPATTTTAAPTTTRDSTGLGGGFGDQGGSATTTTGAGGSTGFVTVTDDTGQITLDVPASWDDVSGAAWVRDDQQIGPAITVSTDRNAWLNSWEVPGVFIGATTTFPGTIDQVLDQWTFGDCVYDARYDYDDGVYTGKFDWWDDCGGIGTAFVTIEARPADEAFTVVVQFQLLTQEDRDAADVIVESYLVSGADV